MKFQPVLIALTVVNLLLLTFLSVRITPATAQDVVPVLRGHALEIVDDRGRVRASITVYPPVTMEGRHYPETVLFRLADPKSGPVVKIEASEHGSAFGFSDDSERGGVVLQAKKGEGIFLELTDREGRKRVIEP